MKRSNSSKDSNLFELHFTECYCALTNASSALQMKKKYQFNIRKKNDSQHVLSLVNNITICIKRPQTGLSRLSVMFNNLIKRLLRPLDFGEWYSGILRKMETISFIQNDFCVIMFKVSKRFSISLISSEIYVSYYPC